MKVTYEKLSGLHPEKRKKLFSIQKEYITIETKVMFERDRNTRSILRKELKELDKQRKAILNV